MWSYCEKVSRDTDESEAEVTHTDVDVDAGGGAKECKRMRVDVVHSVAVVVPPMTLSEHCAAVHVVDDDDDVASSSSAFSAFFESWSLQTSRPTVYDCRSVC